MSIVDRTEERALEDASAGPEVPDHEHRRAHPVDLAIQHDREPTSSGRQMNRDNPPGVVFGMGPRKFFLLIEDEVGGLVVSCGRDVG